MLEKRNESVQVWRYLAPLARYKFLITTFCLSAVLSSLGLTYLVSEKYQASAAVLHQPRETVTFQPKVRDALGFPLPLIPLESIANTLEDIVKGDAVLEQAVRVMRLDVPQKKPTTANWLLSTLRDAKDWFGQQRQNVWQVLKYGRVLPKDSIRAAMERLRRSISVKRTNKAYTFRLEVLDENPQRAAQIVDTLAEILSDFVVRGQRRTAREARENIERRLSQSSNEVERIRKTLEALKEKTGISSLDEELSLRLRTINEFEEHLAKVRHELRSLESRQSELASQIGRQEPVVRYDATTTDNPVFNELRLEQARLEVERSGLLEKMTPQHNEVKAVEAKLAEARQRLKEELPKLLSSESLRLSSVHQKLVTDQLAVQVDIGALRAQEGALVQALRQEIALARKLTASEPNMGQISLRLRAAEKSYQLINEAYEEARLAESTTVSEVALQHRALVPSEPARPIKIVHVGVTLILSLVLAIGFAFLLNFFDTSVRDIEDAEEVLGLPVFATIPAVEGSSQVLLGRPF